MLIYLTRQQDNNEYCRYRELSWKGYDFKALERDRKLIILTCLANKVKMYKKMGFDDKGIADSCWGDEEWHEMCCVLNI